VTAALKTSTTPPAVDVAREIARCAVSVEYFVRHYCQIKDDAEWMAFDLWREQAELLDDFTAHDQVAVLKARQLGLSWLALSWLLWIMVTRPGSTVLIVSLREEEAQALLGDRLQGMWRRLPEWLRGTDDGGVKRWRLSNGSVARALPANRGDSYTASAVLVDEADLIPRLDRLLGSLEPTINDGGQIVLVSRADKARPGSTFKRLWQAGRTDPSSGWSSRFLPWHVRPGRDAQWYAARCRDSMDKDGTLDSVHEQYPATPEQALSPGASGKRLPATHLLPVYELREAAPGEDLDGLPGLRVHSAPAPGRRYVIGADPAEGLLGSGNDDSAAVVVDFDTGEHVATVQGRLEPKRDFPAVLVALSAAYGDAAILVERNNHGHTVIAALEHTGVTLLDGPDGRPGYHKSAPSKARLWADVWGEVVEVSRSRQEDGDAPPLVCDAVCYQQLASLERATCKAPQGQHDDVADAWGLAQAARALPDPAAWLRGLTTG